MGTVWGVADRATRRAGYVIVDGMAALKPA